MSGPYELRFAVAPCALGFALVAVSDAGVRAASLGDDPAALAAELLGTSGAATAVDALEELDTLVAYLERPTGALPAPLDLRGTEFQLRVWLALTEVPAGSSVGYAELAARLGAPRAVRAVGAACGANPAAVFVPCHRALGKDGALTGYRWGLERKRALLERERFLANPRAGAQVSLPWS